MEDYYLNHILYEIEMYLSTLEDYTDPSFANKEQYYKNLVIESFCVHTRNLMDFFLNKENKKYPDDLISSKIINEGKYSKFFEDNLRNLDIDILNKSVCHLTMTRKEKGHAKKCIKIVRDFCPRFLKAIGQFLLDISIKENLTDLVQGEVDVPDVSNRITFVKFIFERVFNELLDRNVICLSSEQNVG